MSRAMVLSAVLALTSVSGAALACTPCDAAQHHRSHTPRCLGSDGKWYYCPDRAVQTDPNRTFLEHGTVVVAKDTSDPSTVVVYAQADSVDATYWDTPRPNFDDLDTNHDGRISEEEAEAYVPLANDFLFASRGGRYITHAQYNRWASRP
jgi:hypothetical protein